MAKTIPFIDSQDDGPGLAMAGDDRRLSVSSFLHERRQLDLGLA